MLSIKVSSPSSRYFIPNQGRPFDTHFSRFAPRRSFADLRRVGRWFGPAGVSDKNIPGRRASELRIALPCLNGRDSGASAALSRKHHRRRSAEVRFDVS